MHVRSRFVILILLLLAGFAIYQAVTTVVTEQVRKATLRSLSVASGGTGQFALSIAHMGLTDFLSGRVRDVDLEARGAVFGGLRYSEIRLKSKEIVVDQEALRLGEPFTVKKLGRTAVQARVSQDDLNNYRMQVWPELPVRFELVEGWVKARTSISLSFGPLDVAFTGRLSPQQSSIRLVPQAVEVQNVVVPTPLIERAIGPLSERLSADIPVRLPIPVTPRTVAIHRGWIAITLTGGVP